jgi:hypothetical protein
MVLSASFMDGSGTTSLDASSDTPGRCLTLPDSPPLIAEFTSRHGVPNPPVRASTSVQLGVPQAISLHAEACDGGLECPEHARLRPMRPQ